MLTTPGIDEGNLTAVDLLEEIGIVLSFCGVALVMLLLGFLLIDLLTPGRLSELIWTERNRNASVIVSMGFVAQGIIVAAAIWASNSEFVEGLITTAAYSLIGLLVNAAVLFVVDRFTPGDVRSTIVHDEPHPGSWVIGTLRVVVAGIIALAII